MVDTAAISFKQDDILPDHTQLPDSDGNFINNFQKHPQGLLLTDSIVPVLEKLHPNENYVIGQSCGIYWQPAAVPPEKGAEAPDWFYVPRVPPLAEGQIRRSYVLWKEFMAPLIAIEFASGSGKEEKDQTPLLRPNEKESTKPGKFWVYERAIRIPYYAVYIIGTAHLEVYQLIGGGYKPMKPNAQGRFDIAPLGVQLGVWNGRVINQIETWLRWWDKAGNLLLTGREDAARATEAEQQANQAAQQANERAERLAQQLRALGIDPEAAET